jgi:hypothetical protein
LDSKETNRIAVASSLLIQLAAACVLKLIPDFWAQPRQRQKTCASYNLVFDALVYQLVKVHIALHKVAKLMHVPNWPSCPNHFAANTAFLYHANLVHGALPFERTPVSEE